jgi:hypothetical protein
MMKLCSRRQSHPLPLNVIIVLCLWLLVGGLARADSFDLADDVGLPHVSSGAIIDSDDDEVREKLDLSLGLVGSFTDKCLR